jgi:hypothetical protein
MSEKCDNKMPNEEMESKVSSLRNLMEYLQADRISSMNLNTAQTNKTEEQHQPHQEHLTLEPPPQSFVADNLPSMHQKNLFPVSKEQVSAIHPTVVVIKPRQ